jgi:hypothetical protein
MSAECRAQAEEAGNQLSDLLDGAEQGALRS